MGADAKRKEARKRKFGADTSEKLQNSGPHLDDKGGVGYKPPRKKSKQDCSKPSSPKDSPLENEETGCTLLTTDAVPEVQELTSAKVQRFIVFIGNLPYTATDQAIAQHFAKVHPKSIRHRTEKEGGKSKGFAFLEFEGYDRMKTCLKLFHGSEFDDAISHPRKLNVELTVGGGGGKSKERKSKLHEKNERLNEQRKRKALEEEKQQEGAKDENSRGQGKSGSHAGKKQESKTRKRPETGACVDNGDIHPSRRSRMAV